jgi:hypothetical protein
MVMTSLLPLLLLFLQSPDDHAKAVVDRIVFPKAEEVKAWADKGPEYANVLTVVMKRETWTAAVKFIEERLAPFADDWKIEVSLTEWEGGHPTQGERAEKAASVRFNMKRLSAYEKKMIDFRRQEAELKTKGKRFAWKIPPLKYDRLIVHELVHVLQGTYKSPEWFREGLASWAGADPNYVMAFLYNNDEVKEVESPLEGDDLYGRSQLFMMWLEKKAGREVLKKAAKATILDGGEAKAALEKLLGSTWEKISAEELAWTTEYARKNRPKKD